MNFKKYILKNKPQHRIENPPHRKFRNSIVIPVCAEAEHLPRTLGSIAENPPGMIEGALIILVINNPPAASAAPAKLKENTSMLESLRSSQFPFQDRLHLCWVDASSPGNEIDPKEGVGAARKIGMDAALEFLDFDSMSPIIISLDADTLVERNYLEAINEYFISNLTVAGATINFAHQPGRRPEENAAIVRYELFMRYYVEGLRFSQSPYAYHVLGSAMAFRASEYVRAGGMRKRNGGEDFYFMQALRKIGMIGQICGTTVYPSSRPSDRVPFGTGPRISQIMQGTKELRFYNPEIFFILKNLFSAISSIDSACHAIPFAFLDEATASFMSENKFFHEWEKILRNTPRDKEKTEWAFHTWFDAFRTLKFVHYCEERYPEVGLMEAFRELSAKSGDVLPLQGTESELLGFLRLKETIRHQAGQGISDSIR